jgi:hypothetical protein
MSPFGATPAVLAAYIDGGVLTLRIDQNLFSSELDAGAAVRVVSFEACDFDGQVEGWVGKHIEFEEFDDDGSTRVQLYIDYLADYVEFRCSSVRDSTAEYTKEDLATKVATLARVASEYSESWDRVSRELRDLRDVLGKEIDREIDRDQRKAGFFARSHAERAKALEAQVNVLRQLRSRLDPRS